MGDYTWAERRKVQDSPLDPETATTADLTREAANLRDVAAALVRAVEGQKRTIRFVIVALCVDVFLTLGIGNAMTMQCNGRNSDAKRQHDLWEPLLTTATNPEAKKFKDKLDLIFPQLDCSVASVAKRTFEHHPGR